MTKRVLIGDHPRTQMNRFDVELVGFEGEPDVDAFARSFAIDERAARALVAAVPRIVKRDVEEAQAEELFHALRGLGARVQLHRLPPRSNRPPPNAELPAPDLPVPDLDDPPPPPLAPPPASLAPARMAPATNDTLGEARPPFATDLGKAYLYPFQWMFPVVVIGVAAFSQAFGYTPYVGAFLSAGFWATAVFTALRYAANGRNDLPGMEFDGFYEMALPGVRFMLAIFVPAVLLGVLYGVLAVGSASAESVLTGESRFSLASAPLLFLVALGLWLIYLPASLILAAHSTGCLGGLNLVGGVQLIVRAPLAYALTVGAAAPAGLATIGVWTAANIVDQAVPIPFVIGFAGKALALVPGMIVGRILGLFIWHHEHELGLS